MRQVALGLHHAHLNGVVHRDVKPANVLVGKDGQAHVADFGLAFMAGEGRSRLTSSGEMMGTPYYMAPEQWRDAASVGPAADQYALGCMLYEAIVGAPPFQGRDIRALGDVVRQEDPSPPRALRPGLHRDLEVICLKALQKEPARRYASCQDLAEDLRRFLNIEPIAARPAGPLERLGKWARRKPALATALGLAATLGLAFALYLFRGHLEAQHRAIALADKIAALLRRGDGDFAAGQHVQALKAYQEVLGLNHDQPEALRQIPRVEAAMRQVEGAKLQIWMDLQQLGDPQQLRDLEQVDGYIAAVGELIEKNATVRHEEAYYRRGLVRSFRGDFQGAREDLDQTLELSPDHRAARYLRVKLNALSRSRRDLLRDDVDYLAEHFPQDPMTTLARLFVIVGPDGRVDGYDISQEQLERLEWSDAFFLRALQACFGREAAAQPFVSSFAAAEAFSIRPTVVFRNMDVERVIELLDACLEREPFHFPARQLRGSIRCGWLADYAPALDDLDLCQKVEPDVEVVLWDRAKAYEGLGRLDEAQADYVRLVQLHPTRTKYRCDLAILLALRLRLDEARRALSGIQRQADLDLENSLVLVLQAFISALLGDFEPFRREFAEVRAKWELLDLIAKALEMSRALLGPNSARILRRQGDAAGYFTLAPGRKKEVRSLAELAGPLRKSFMDERSKRPERMGSDAIALGQLGRLGEALDVWHYGTQGQTAAYRNCIEAGQIVDVDLLGLMGMLRYCALIFQTAAWEAQSKPTTWTMAFERAAGRFLTGRFDDATADLAFAITRQPRQAELHLALATVLAAQSTKADLAPAAASALRHQARQALAQAYSLGWQNLGWLRTDPDFAPLMRYKAFQEFLEETQ